MVHVRWTGRCRLDREHEHGPRWQQETLPQQRRDHQTHRSTNLFTGCRKPPFSLSITSSLFYSRLQTCLFLQTIPTIDTFSSPSTESMISRLLPLLQDFRFFVFFSFLPLFFQFLRQSGRFSSLLCQLLSLLQCIVISHRIVPYRYFTVPYYSIPYHTTPYHMLETYNRDCNYHWPCVGICHVAHDDDVRSTRPCGGVSSHCEPVWHGLPGTRYPRSGSVHRQLASPTVWHHLPTQGQASTALWYVPWGHHLLYIRVKLSLNLAQLQSCNRTL